MSQQPENEWLETIQNGLPHILKALLMSICVFLLYTSVIIPNILLGFWEIQKGGNEQFIIPVFFILPCIGYTLLGIKKGFQFLAQRFWDHVLATEMKNLSTEIASKLLHLNQDADLKLTGKAFLDEAKKRLGKGIFASLVYFMMRHFIDKHLFDIQKNTDKILTQENLEREIFQKAETYYIKSVVKLKIPNVFINFMINILLPFLVYLNIGLVIWYYTQVTK